MSLSLPACPPGLKAIQHYLKIATEHETRDPVITYWARLTALQNGLAIDKSSKEALAVLLPLMDWLENEKQVKKELDSISNEIVASAHVENYAMKLFVTADKQDRAGNFGKNVVKCFYSAGVLFDVMETFGELSPETAHYRKYAKMKAAYIHNCLKNGETPVAGPLVEEGEDQEEDVSIPVPAPRSNTSEYKETSQHPPPPQNYPPSQPQNYPPPQPQNYPPQQPQSYPPAQQPTAPASHPGGSGGAGAPPATGLSMDQMARAQKLCKFAISSLDYQDTTTAVENLTKALTLLQTGREH